MRLAEPRISFSLMTPWAASARYGAQWETIAACTMNVIIATVVMAVSFGWDWVPTLVTAGIWRPVRLEGWSTARIDPPRSFCTSATR
jgi:N-acyl-L-homoserine lactone synthetase